MAQKLRAAGGCCHCLSSLWDRAQRFPRWITVLHAQHQLPKASWFRANTSFGEWFNERTCFACSVHIIHLTMICLHLMFCIYMPLGWVCVIILLAVAYGDEWSSHKHKVPGSIPALPASCMSKCPWARHWTTSCSPGASLQPTAPS